MAFKTISKKSLSIVVVVLTVTLGLLSFAPKDHYFEIAKNLDIFASLYKELNTYYVDDINPNTIVRKGIDGMLKTLDPYTVYIPEDDIEDYRTMSTGEYGGIGALTNTINGEHVVLMIYEGYPAFEAGLKIGDIIVEVDGVNVTGYSNDELGKLLKGQSDTKASIKVRRYGVDKPVSITLVRKNVKIENVTFKGMVTSDIGMVKLSEFMSDAGKDVKNAVAELKKQGAKKIIIDLRDNPGGLLHESVNLCNIFIPKGKVVVDTKGKIKDLNKTYKTLDEAFDTDIPLAVLINSMSASASEIVSGVMQDYDRGVVIGQKSFGKGLVQASRPLSYNSQLKITTAKYYTPSGRCIQALDYSNRNEDGSVGAVPDSLKSRFYTTNGREVYDGGGIDPDISVKPWEPAAIVLELADQGLLFSFATKFAHENPSISSPKEFEVTDKIFEDFKKWTVQKNFTHKTKTRENISKLIATAKSENYYQGMEASLKSLETAILDLKDNSLNLFSDDIKVVLKEEIVSRYYFEKGVIEASLGGDKEVQKAIEILNSPNEYKRLLSKK